MHIILLLIVLFALYLFFKQQNANKIKNNSETQGNSNSEPSVKLQTDVDITYLSKGKLFSSVDNTLDEIQSSYIQKLIDKAEQNEARHGWKKDTSWGTTPVGGVRNFGSGAIDVEFTAAEVLPDNKLLYFLKGEGFGGLFSYDKETKEEKRISHHQNLDYTNLKYNAEQDKILCASNQASGVSNIVVMDANGDSSRELTGGDTEDISPSWLPGDNNQIVFQSMGLARSSEGYIMARGPASIQLLDMEKGELSSVMENNAYDFIDPTVSKNGDLYFIRRPFEQPHYKSSNLIIDTLMFPFRLLKAVFHYLNFFSLMYTREPLTSASSPYAKADLKEMLIKGKRINAEEALKKGYKVHGVASLVPKTWELIRKDKHGNEQTLANCVSSFDISDDDQLIYSNGYAVFSLDKNAESTLIFKDTLVNEVIA